MQTVRAYSSNGTFIPFQPIRVPNGSQAIVTILDFPVDKPPVDNMEEQGDENFAAWHRQLKETIAFSMDEELPDEYFQRSNEMRPPLDFV